ncbi:MAG: hypothetical protein EP297_14020 [Gammaproteobacteria bacterium]|nr:MAG: hypothetical protein EP297_14020 [Gammaproteobacteria bacterium]
MDFFQHQDDARKKTIQMVFLFVLAVISIVLALNAVFTVFFLWMQADTRQLSSSLDLPTRLSNVPPELWVAVTVVTSLFIVGGSFYKIMQLSGGGESVARMVGARKVSRHTNDHQEKQLLNVVDEMAIASGVSVPQVYVMDDELSINAFAAGYKPNEAIVAVTRGTLEQLDRDELQGVIAHEFSHILNGDMRLNIRLMGVLFGILIIGIIGGYMLRSMGRSRYRSSSSGGKNAGAVLAIGLALFVIGYTGVFFGRLIKAGVSRQREYLADASAVQFTRNPEGITGALKKIGKLDDSLMHGQHAEELSHMYFSQGVTIMMSGLLATHPPLTDRIKRINKGRIPPSAKRKKVQIDTEASAQFVAEQSVAGAVQPDKIVQSIGQPGSMHMLYAAALLEAIPAPVTDALAMEKGSRALMFALVLDGQSEVREQELAILRTTAHKDLESEVVRLANELERLGDKFRLPLFDMAMPVLKGLPIEERSALIESVKAVIDADRKIKLQELTIHVLMKAHLSEKSAKAEKIRYRMLADLQDEIEMVLTLLAHLGKTDENNANKIFGLAASELSPVLTDVQIRDIRKLDPNDLIVAMEKFSEMKPALKKRLTSACVAAVMADEHVTIRELEVMRSLCAVMDVPMPPVVTEQSGSNYQ